MTCAGWCANPGLYVANGISNQSVGDSWVMPASGAQDPLGYYYHHNVTGATSTGDSGGDLLVVCGGNNVNTTKYNHWLPGTTFPSIRSNQPGFTPGGGVGINMAAYAGMTCSWKVITGDSRHNRTITIAYAELFGKTSGPATPFILEPPPVALVQFPHIRGTARVRPA